MPRRQGLFRLYEGEEGVTAVIVALCLVGLIGMMVLVVDVGGLLWRQRQMVNAADAAALAAAKTCSLTYDADPSDPEQQADTAAVSNSTGLIPQDGGIVQSFGCTQASRSSTGYVTVQYSQPQQLFFAGIFGKSSQTVTAQATAAWGPLRKGAAVPVVLDTGRFQSSCDVPEPDPDTLCTFWYTNSVGSNTGIGAGAFGFLNLDTWGIDRYSSGCKDGGSTVGNYVLYDYNGKQSLSLANPGPTYVCLDHGAQVVDWFSSLCARWSEEIQPPSSCNYIPDPKTPYQGWPGNQLLMPVNDCAQQVDNKGAVVPCGADYTNVDKFAIVGFTTLQLGDLNNPTMPAVLRGNDPRAIGTVGASGSCPNSTTLGPATAGKYGLGGWDVNSLATSQCGAPSAPDAITNLTITSGSGGNAKTYTQCTPTTLSSSCDYVYDDAARAIDWYNNATRTGASNYEIHFGWSMASTPGYCGIRSADSSALCIITTWKGFTSVEGEVGGKDFGTRGFVLCDFTYNSCPAGVKP